MLVVANCTTASSWVALVLRAALALGAHGCGDYGAATVGQSAASIEDSAVVSLAMNWDGIPPVNTPFAYEFDCNQGAGTPDCTDNPSGGTFHSLEGSFAEAHAVSSDQSTQLIEIAVRFQSPQVEGVALREYYAIEVDLATGAVTPVESGGSSAGQCHRGEGGEYVNFSGLLCPSQDLCVNPGGVECQELCLISQIAAGWELCYTVEIQCNEGEACSTDLGDPCGVVPGINSCTGSATGTCLPIGNGAPETSYDSDNDCDLIYGECDAPQSSWQCDSGLPGPDCNVGNAACDVFGAGPCVGPVASNERGANNFDDDCDGLRDECEPGQQILGCSADLGVPECPDGGPGFAACIDGFATGPCSVLPAGFPNKEILGNGLDDDCNGIVDDCSPLKQTALCSAPLRSCPAADGTALCANDGTPGPCIPNDITTPTICPKPACRGGSMALDTDLPGTPGFGNPDNDDDGLWDCWETEAMDTDEDGTLDAPGSIDVNADGVPDFPLVGADPNHKNLYLEVDYMVWHQPQRLALDDVEAAFAAAPAADVNNPDAAPGITLNIQDDELLDPTGTGIHEPLIRMYNCPSGVAPSMGTPDFDALKSTFFGTAVERGRPGDAQGSFAVQAKRYVYHYFVFAHDMEAPGGVPFGPTGCAEQLGNDGVITLANVQHDNAGNYCPSDVSGGTCRGLEAALLMHEFGHNLGLAHGGNDWINCVFAASVRERMTAPRYPRRCEARDGTTKHGAAGGGSRATGSLA